MLNYSIRARKFQSPINNMHGVCDLVIDDRIVVPGFKILESKKGDLFVAAPSVKSNKTDDAGKAIYYNCINFIDRKADEKDFKTPLEQEICDAMLAEFNSATPSAGKAASTGGDETPPVSAAPKAKGAHPLWKNR